MMLSPWAEPAPDVGHHLPGGACWLDADPRPTRPIGLGQARVIHGLVSAISRIGHHPTIPTIAIGPWPGGLGWAAYLATDSAARAMAGRTYQAHLFGRPCNVRCGPLMRLRFPVVGDVGPRELDVVTRTPLVIRGNGRAHGRRPRPGALTSTLHTWLPRRVGLDPPHAVRTEVVAWRGGWRQVRIGGHLGVADGWEGTLRVRTNAVGEWLWRLGALIGVGGRVGFGFGRVEVTRCER